MVAEAILDLIFQRKCSSWASRSQNFACGACNGCVTVRKRFVFVFCLGGPSPPRGRAGAHLTGNQKHSALLLFADAVGVALWLPIDNPNVVVLTRHLGHAATARAIYDEHHVLAAAHTRALHSAPVPRVNVSAEALGGERSWLESGRSGSPPDAPFLASLNSRSELAVLYYARPHRDHEPTTLHMSIASHSVGDSISRIASE